MQDGQHDSITTATSSKGKKIPEKSIDTLFVSCTLELVDSQLDLDVQLEISQLFDTGHSLDDLLQEATDFGVEWLENQLTEMKKK